MATPGASGPVTTNSSVIASPEQVSSDLAGETVLLSLTNATYHGLEGVGAKIWELVQREIRVEEVVNALVAEYAIDRPTCERDVLAFLRQCADRGLIEVRGGA
jgi:hypothetical protein